MTLTVGQNDKFGLVTILNPDGTLNRQFRITAKEYAALGQKDGGPPPGCTAEEWWGMTKTGANIAWAAGQGCDVGDMLTRPDGSLILKYDASQPCAVFASEQWSGIPPLVTVQKTAVDAIPGQPLDSIIGGVATAKVVVIK